VLPPFVCVRCKHDRMLTLQNTHTYTRIYEHTYTHHSATCGTSTRIRTDRNAMNTTSPNLPPMCPEPNRVTKVIWLCSTSIMPLVHAYIHTHTHTQHTRTTQHTQSRATSAKCPTHPLITLITLIALTHTEPCYECEVPYPPPGPAVVHHAEVEKNPVKRIHALMKVNLPWRNPKLRLATRRHAVYLPRDSRLHAGVWVREYVWLSEGVSEWVREWVSAWVSEWDSERVCVCVCVCVREREREPSQGQWSSCRWVNVEWKKCE